LNGAAGKGRRKEKSVGYTSSDGVDLEKIRVVLADDHPFLRTGLRKILDKTPDIVVVGEADDGAQALSLVESLTPDVLVLDVEMPRLNGIQVARELSTRESHVRILVLSAHDDRAHILGMLDAGVAGYLTKDEASDVLVKAVRRVAEGKDGWLSQRVAKKIGPAASDSQNF
jgi:DNA-binding NarL/FixJ family response regulator